tara:strand:+ start:28 stop:801 length:774 start_codon:yes stop_codon:yes gene_type:complete
MRPKKAQITLFVVIGIIIIITISFLFFLRQDQVRDLTSINENKLRVEPVETFIQSCIDSVGEEAVYFIGLQGGYYNTPSPNINYSYIKIPIYWNVNQEKTPSKETIESELLEYVKDNLNSCTNHLSVFIEQGFEFKEGEVNGKVSLTTDKVIFEIDYPIEVQIDENIHKLDRFISTINLNLDQKYGFVSQIMEEQKKTPDSIPYGFVTNLAYQNDFVFETMNIEEDIVLFTLIFNDKNTKGQPFIYSFAARYDWGII